MEIKMKWAEFAKYICEVELGETFLIPERSSVNAYVIREDGIYSKSLNGVVFFKLDPFTTDDILLSIFKGSYHIKSLPYKPRYGDIYYYPVWNEIEKWIDSGSKEYLGTAQDYLNAAHELCYRTHGECKNNLKSDYKKITGKEWEY